MSDVKIFTDQIEGKAAGQIQALVRQPAFADCKVRIMPDVHAGRGCVIGFTADLGDKVIPNIVGVDIGCGMLTAPIGAVEIDFARLDEVIRAHIPSGRAVRAEPAGFDAMEGLHCRAQLREPYRLRCSLGTLGGGNHFIEVDEDETGVRYLVIHTGSRNLGKQVAQLYQDQAIRETHRGPLYAEMRELAAAYRRAGRQAELQAAMKELKRQSGDRKVPREFCYLTGEGRERYLHDMEICQQFAARNRQMIMDTIFRQMGWQPCPEGTFQTIHNYIDRESNIVRKGAISARLGERVLIPINMRDGCILGVGKGNDDWNQSAPHGAGRLMSRAQAKETVSLDDFRASMEGIYTTSVSRLTLDESPMAYKPMDEIVHRIRDTVEIEKIIKPVYNFKAPE